MQNSAIRNIPDFKHMVAVRIHIRVLKKRGTVSLLTALVDVDFCDCLGLN